MDALTASFPTPPPPLAICCGLLALLMPASVAAQTGEVSERDGAITLFAGVMTDNHWEEVFTPWEPAFRDSYLAGIAASHRIARLGRSFDIEIEGQIVRHSGDQDHWEINLPILGRWRSFPWDDTVDTSVAWGIGPSYATEIPAVELANNANSQRWLVYWVAELELAPADSPWSGVLRIHHRSDAFGLVADDGGSNALAIGLRRRF